MTLVSGIRSGLRVGLRSGLNPGVSGIAGVTRDSGNSNYYPASAAEWTTFMAAIGLATGNPTHAWNFQDAAGNPTDFISGAVLTSTLTAYQSAVPGATRKCIRGVEGAATKMLNTTTTPNPSTTSMLLLAFLDISAAPAAVRDVMTFSTTVDLRYNTNGKLRLVSAGSSDLANVCGASQRWVALQCNLTATTIKAFNDQEKLTGVFGVPANLIALAFGGQSATTSATGYSYGAIFAGAAAELTDAQMKTLLQGLGATIPW